VRCSICGVDLSKWNLDITREVECGMCVQRALNKFYPGTQIPAESPQKPVEGRTATTTPPWTGSKWDRKKNPIKWEDLL